MIRFWVDIINQVHLLAHQDGHDESSIKRKTETNDLVPSGQYSEEYWVQELINCIADNK